MLTNVLFIVRVIILAAPALTSASADAFGAVDGSVCQDNLHLGRASEANAIQMGVLEASSGSLRSGIRVPAGEAYADFPSVLQAPVHHATLRFSVSMHTFLSAESPVSTSPVLFGSALLQVDVTVPIAGKTCSVPVLVSNVRRNSNGPRKEAALTFKEPIQLKVPRVKTALPLWHKTPELELACVYWDEDAHQWSDEGITSVRISSDWGLCNTTHLSMFALIWRPTTTTTTTTTSTTTSSTTSTMTTSTVTNTVPSGPCAQGSFPQCRTTYTQVAQALQNTIDTTPVDGQSVLNTVSTVSGDVKTIVLKVGARTFNNSGAMLALDGTSVQIPAELVHPGYQGSIACYMALYGDGLTNISLSTLPRVTQLQLWLKWQLVEEASCFLCRDPSRSECRTQHHHPVLACSCCVHCGTMLSENGC